MTKDEKLEATTYRIKCWGANSYQIDKLIMGVEVEQYQLTIKAEGRASLDLWCNCPGFRIQQFPKIEHKHIKIALDYQSRGEPTWAEYTITGTGKKAEIKFIGDSSENGSAN